ncbi:hypothetical protein D9M72_336320 [compost metagenome]
MDGVDGHAGPAGGLRRRWRGIGRRRAAAPRPLSARAPAGGSDPSPGGRHHRQRPRRIAARGHRLHRSLRRRFQRGHRGRPRGHAGRGTGARQLGRCMQRQRQHLHRADGRRARRDGHLRRRTAGDRLGRCVGAVGRRRQPAEDRDRCAGARAGRVAPDRRQPPGGPPVGQPLPARQRLDRTAAPRGQRRRRA